MRILSLRSKGKVAVKPLTIVFFLSVLLCVHCRAFALPLEDTIRAFAESSGDESSGGKPRVVVISRMNSAAAALKSVAPDNQGLALTHIELKERGDMSAAELAKTAQELSTAALVVVLPEVWGGFGASRVKDSPRIANLLALLAEEKLGLACRVAVSAKGARSRCAVGSDLSIGRTTFMEHALFFSQTERLSHEEIASRIVSPVRFQPLVLREYFERQGRSTEIFISDVIPAGVADLARWLLVVGALSMLVFPLAFIISGRSSKIAVGFALLLGCVLPGYIAWTLRNFDILSPSRAAHLFVIACMAGISVLTGWRIFREALLSGSIRGALRGYAVFAFGFFAFLALRVFQPEIYWGEKPMDFTFLNFFARNPPLPPEDPWAAGSPMHYYYLGFFLYAFLHDVAAVDTIYGYHFSVATVGALLFSVLFSVFSAVMRNSRAAFGSALAICFLSNLEWIYLLFVKDMRLGFDFFWATSRLMTSPSFVEYPLWSQLFGDLHPHIMAQPVVAAVLGLAVMTFGRWSAARESYRASLEGPWSTIRPLLPELAVLALLFGITIALNSWDSIGLALVVSLMFVLQMIAILRSRREAPARLLWAEGALLVAVYGGLGCCSLATASPFLFEAGAAQRVGWGWVTAGEFNSVMQVFRHVGLWLSALLMGCAVVFFQGSAWRRLADTLWGALFLFLPSVLVYGSLAAKVSVVPLGVLAVTALLIWSGSAIAVGRDRSEADRALGVMALGGGLILLAAELLYFMDRMNTIFKFYQVLWLVLGMGACLVVFTLTEKVRSARDSIRPLPVAVISLFLVILLLAVAGSVFNVYSMLTFQRIAGPRPSLDGLAYLKQSSPSEWMLAQWIRRHIKGLPVLLEAHGPSYQNYTRISMYTGLPTILGWDYHVSQRGTSRDEIARRKRAVADIYSSPDSAHALDVVRDYQIELIVVGRQERITYPSLGLEKFERDSKLFPVIARFDDVVLYATPLFAVERPT